MRIWDLPPTVLCRKHLLGEHRELHGLWNILTSDKQGYRNHPETKRWVGKLPALWERHHALVTEMEQRNYRHTSPLTIDGYLEGSYMQDEHLHTLDEQREILREKGCECQA